MDKADTQEIISESLKTYLARITSINDRTNIHAREMFNVCQGSLELMGPFMNLLWVIDEMQEATKHIVENYMQHLENMLDE